MNVQITGESGFSDWWTDPYPIPKIPLSAADVTIPIPALVSSGNRDRGLNSANFTFSELSIPLFFFPLLSLLSFYLCRI